MTGIVKTKMNYWIIMELMRFLRQTNKMISPPFLYLLSVFAQQKVLSSIGPDSLFCLLNCWYPPSTDYWTNSLGRIFICQSGEETRRTLTSTFTLCFLGKPSHSHLLGIQLGIQVIFKLRMEIFGIESLLTLM